MKKQILPFYPLLFLLSILILSIPCSESVRGETATQKPEGLRVDLLAFPSQSSLIEIRTLNPSFCWQNADARTNCVQTGYQIQLIQLIPGQNNSEQPESAGSVVDTGRVASACSTSVFLPESIRAKKPFAEGQTWRWRVRVWSIGDKSESDESESDESKSADESNSDESKTADESKPQPAGNVDSSQYERISDWSEYQEFRFGKNIKPFEVSYYPITQYVQAAQGQRIDDKTTFFDFAQAAFAQIVVRAKTEKATTIVVRAGERMTRDENNAPHVDQKPAGTTRFAEYRLDVRPEQEVYAIQTRKDRRNTSGAAFLMPDYIGEVMPYRYVEIERTDETPLEVNVDQVRAVYLSFNEALLGPGNANAARFQSDSKSLNQVWELCRYSIAATSFLGVYVDGDRERIPYEGDALLNQLSHYAVEPEYSMARRTAEYLIFHPTWPTEWNLQIPQMFWFDYLYTGDTRAIEYYYDELKAKSMIALAEPNGLISTRKGKVTKDFLKSIHFGSNPSGFRDIVDWPHKGLAGNENANSGETDGFVFDDFNAVVNAYHFFAVNSMYKFALILNKKDEAAFLKTRIDQIRDSYQTVFFDSARGVYKDGDKTDHASLHGNMFPLAFGLVPSENVESVTRFVKSRKMACSVYGAQFLLEAVYNGNDGAYGLERMSSDDRRGWLNMLRAGSTISMEAWDDRYKPNQDWNHAWGAAPANIIPRKLVGVEPLEPGCAKIRIKPQIGDLTTVDADVPTIRGNVGVSIKRGQTGAGQESCSLTVRIPWNVNAEVWIPTRKDASTRTEAATAVCLFRNGKAIQARQENGFFVVDDLGSGVWTLEVRAIP